MKKSKPVAVIVAHPDDETLWVGGTILEHPSWDWFIITLCRASDSNRAPKFYRVMDILGANGIMGDLDDGPEQKPLDEKKVQETILMLLTKKRFELIITHDPAGEYTRHLRHEETAKAVISLWFNGGLSANELRTFAYEDGGKEYLPRAISNAHLYHALPRNIWQKKYTIITEIYGFDKNSFEAETTPYAEAFWQFKSPQDGWQWLHKGGKIL